MKLKQQNDSDSATLEQCSDDVVCTGQMTECVSIILLCTDNTCYGIHCGGGITGGWSEKIIKLFTATLKKCKKLIVIFGGSYQDTNERPFLAYKVDAVKDIFTNIAAGSIEIYSSWDFEYNISSGKTNEDCKTLNEKLEWK